MTRTSALSKCAIIWSCRARPRGVRLTQTTRRFAGVGLALDQAAVLQALEHLRDGRLADVAALGQLAGLEALALEKRVDGVVLPLAHLRHFTRHVRRKLLGHQLHHAQPDHHSGAPSAVAARPGLRLRRASLPTAPALPHPSSASLDSRR